MSEDKHKILDHRITFSAGMEAWIDLDIKFEDLKIMFQDTFDLNSFKMIYKNKDDNLITINSNEDLRHAMDYIYL